MPTSTGDMMIRWSIRLAIAAYFVTAALRMRGHRGSAARCCWTVGLAMLVTHVALAFALVHEWSHQAAWDDTAQQTDELFGINWGGGVWFNYMFMAVWGADAAFWWIAGSARYRERSVAIDWALHSFFIFMIVNGAVVFATGPVRWATLAALAWFGILGIRLILVRRRGTDRPIPEEKSLEQRD